MLLSTTRQQLKSIIDSSKLSPEQRAVFKTDKISKGENYLGLPYHVLDYPAFFSQKDTFAFRTMFWWGNFFSCTLHLEGQFLDHLRRKVIEHLSTLEENKMYLCVGDTPWQYHFGSDNYKLISHNDAEFIEKCQFLKLSKKIELERYETLPKFAGEILSSLLNIMDLENKGQ